MIFNIKNNWISERKYSTKLNTNNQYSYGDTLKRFGSINRIIDSNKHGLTKVYPCFTTG